MYLATLNRLLLIVMLFVLSWSTSVSAAATVSITSSGNSSYTVQGTGMDGVAGIQLDIVYDTASLSTPTVTQGGLVAGAMFTANTSRPGLIKIAIISTNAFSGSGQIVTITFASKKAAAPLPSVTSNMIDSKGSPLVSSTTSPATDTAAAGTILTPGVPFSQPLQPQQQQQSSITTTASRTVSVATPAYLGAVTLPVEQLQPADSHPATSSTAPLASGEPTATTPIEPTQPFGKSGADTEAEKTSQYVIYKGVLDLFRQYNGNKSLPAMVALFDNKVAQTIHQEPAILLSDGQSKASLTVDIPARISSAPNFAVNGGTLVSFKHDKKSEGRWIVEVLPEAGSIKVTVTIIAGAEEFEFLLTVAPPVKTVLTLDESGWNRFIKEIGTATAPLHDFNNDGVRDYMDEFIFVANHLARKSTPAKLR